MSRFNVNDVFDFLENFSEYSKGEKIRIFKKLFNNDEFKKWLFCPDEKDRKLTQNVSRLYEGLTKAKAMKSIIAALDDEDYEFDRTIATLIYSISNIAKEAGTERINSLVNKRKDGDISDKEYRKMKEEAEKYIELTEELFRCSKRIVKNKAKSLSRISKMPKKVCSMALYNTPNVKYINKYKIGFYLNNMLPQIYSYVDEENSSLFGFFKGEPNYKWNSFFKELFGESNLIEIATFCLLEGVHRISQYKSDAVEECWNSLTDWALNQLEEAPEGMRNQMIELYIKRISKMFANKTFDLRVNLLKLSKALFPSLTKSISKYSNKIESIIMKK